MDFSEAFAKVRERHYIRRESWPKSWLVVHQEAYPQGIGINANTARATGLPEGTQVSFQPYLMRYSNSRGCVPWTPDQLDLFATDWTAEPVRENGPKIPAEAMG